MADPEPTKPNPDPAPNPDPPNPAPNPDPPNPAPNPDPPKADGPSRQEFDSLSESVGKLVSSVADLVAKLGDGKDSTPLDKGPWTSWGSKRDNNV